jgi:hypothetical protein
MTTRRPNDDANANSGAGAGAGAEDFESALLARQRLVPRFDVHADDAPPPELDQRVLARARDALRRESPPQPQRRAPRWAVPVALAAIVLLSFGLVMQLDPLRNDAVLAPTAPVAMQEAASESTSEAAGRLGPASASAEPAGEAQPARSELRKAASAAPAVQGAATVAAATKAPAPPAAAPADTSARETAMARVGDPTSAAAASARQSAPAAAAATAATAAASPTARGRPASNTVADAAVADESTSASASAVVSASGSGAGAGAVAGAIPRDDPQRWLAAIERLQRDGNVEAARTELAAFRRRHPDQALPESLQRLR